MASIGLTLGSGATVVLAAVTAEFADLTLEELLNESVTSVSKKETRLLHTPSAITVISHDEIAKLGITHLADALRLSPGINVARMDASHWAVSGRGFNATYGNKLLVLMDGRSLFTPTYGGVFWGQQDMMLEDLKRIEVIRGPGASLWGANAVNGVGQCDQQIIARYSRLAVRRRGRQPRAMDQ